MPKFKEKEERGEEGGGEGKAERKETMVSHNQWLKYFTYIHIITVYNQVNTLLGPHLETLKGAKESEETSN
jgi:hypothetical protein